MSAPEKVSVGCVQTNTDVSLAQTDSGLSDRISNKYEPDVVGLLDDKLMRNSYS